MTDAQKIILKNDINAKLNTVITGGTIGVNIANSNFKNIADYYNTTTASNLWRPDVTNTEISASVVNSAYTALTAVKQNGLSIYLQCDKTDATSQNVRDGFNNIFGAGTTLTNLTAVSKKLATNFEMLFVGATVQSAFICTMYGYLVTGTDIQEALRS